MHIITLENIAQVRVCLFAEAEVVERLIYSTFSPVVEDYAGRTEGIIASENNVCNSHKKSQGETS